MSEFSLILGAWAAVGLTLALYSFLYKDNPVFKIAEHLYVGAGMGWLFQQTFFNVWKPKIYEPLMQGNLSPVIPSILGLSLVAQFFPRISWVSRYGFTFIMGYGAGLTIPTSVATNFISQIEGTIKPLFHLVPGGGVDFSGPALWAAFNFLLIAGGLICVLFYFVFSVEHKGVIKKASNVGIYFLMLYFGAAFGNTVMGRFSLLYGRFDDLYKYSASKYYYATPVLLAALIIFYVIYGRISRKAGEAE
ncbi:MAG: hypothetical protein ABIG11_10165 [bacterium]